MPRSLKKGPVSYPDLQIKIQEAKKTLVAGGKPSPIKTRRRSATITPEMVGITFQVHSGRKFEDVFVTEQMVGHKLGEFVNPTYFKSHGGKKA